MAKLCPSIPSSVAAYRLVEPDPSAVPDVLLTWAGRAALIAIGLALAQRNDAPSGHLMRDSLYAAAALEGFLLFYANRRTREFERLEAAGAGAESCGCGPRAL